MQLKERGLSMRCYNYGCKEDCDDLKIKYCLNKVSKEQFKIKKRYGCMNCGGKEVKVKYENKRVRLCTNCGIIRQGKNILHFCMINSRRLG